MMGARAIRTTAVARNLTAPRLQSTGRFEKPSFHPWKGAATFTPGDAISTRSNLRSNPCKMVPMSRCVLVLVAILGPSVLVAAEPQFSPAQRDFWAFRPPTRNALPDVKNQTWARTPIDLFILAKLETSGLAPSPEADRLTWLRRVTFDLIGLPPTIDEQDHFLADRSPTAFETVVERLLASPHYGERWAQHWLDVVRYAETNGYEADGERPHA